MGIQMYLFYQGKPEFIHIHLMEISCEIVYLAIVCGQDSRCRIKHSLRIRQISIDLSFRAFFKKKLDYIIELNFISFGTIICLFVGLPCVFFLNLFTLYFQLADMIQRNDRAHTKTSMGYLTPFSRSIKFLNRNLYSRISIFQASNYF